MNDSIHVIVDATQDAPALRATLHSLRNQLGAGLQCSVVCAVPALPAVEALAEGRGFPVRVAGVSGAVDERVRRMMAETPSNLVAVTRAGTRYAEGHLEKLP